MLVGLCYLPPNLKLPAFRFWPLSPLNGGPYFEFRAQVQWASVNLQPDLCGQKNVREGVMSQCIESLVCKFNKFSPPTFTCRSRMVAVSSYREYTTYCMNFTFFSTRMYNVNHLSISIFFTHDTLPFLFWYAQKYVHTLCFWGKSPQQSKYNGW